jgi:hypothetical protein
MATCTAARPSIAAGNARRVEKSAIRYELTPRAAAVPTGRARRRGWAGPTVA